MQQLADAHALQREQERCIAELHEEIERQLRDMRRSKDQRIGDLVKELEQCRKREDAVQKVFRQNHETVQELGLKMRALESKEAELDTKEKRLNAKEEALEEKNKELEAEENDLMEDRKRLETQERGHRNSTTAGSTEQRLGRAVFIHYIGKEDLFEVKNTEKFDIYDLPISVATMNDTDVQLLRRHDYYAGWYDCMTHTCHKSRAERHPRFGTKHPYLNDVQHAANPENAGLNAGQLFTFAALCQKHKPEWSIRLDDRTWDLETLVPKMRSTNSHFWRGFDMGKADMEARFPEILRTKG